MRVLFLTLLDFNSLEEHNIYTDLLRCFTNENHSVYIVSPREKRNNKGTEIIIKDNVQILKIEIGNITKCGLIEKGISTLRIEDLYIKTIKKYYSDVHFDLILYSTPPITFGKVIEYVKKRDHAKSYLLLKDIFPQNAVDLGMFSSKGLMHAFFRKKEKELYDQSDYIGCMSQANVDYLLKHNPWIDPKKVEICPNSIEPITIKKNEKLTREIREKYNIPKDKIIFIYGGNLGKPQGIDHIIACLKACTDHPKAYFVIAGSGTEYPKIKAFLDQTPLSNVRLLHQLPKEEYELLVNTCDVGLIFLDHRFTIPNFPSRLLSYMQASIPVFACTDSSTDIGKMLIKGGFGWWCESNDEKIFYLKVLEICKLDVKNFGENARKYLLSHYQARQGYEIIMNKIQKKYNLKKVAFIGGLFPKELEKEVLNDSIGQPQNAANLLQWNIIDGLDNYLKEPITILNSLFIGSFPRRYKKLIIKANKFNHSEKKYHVDFNLPFFNAPLFKQISKIYNIKKSIRLNIIPKDYDVVFGYSMTTPIVKSLLYAKRKNPQLVTCLIVPDLPEYMNMSEKKSLLFRILKFINNKSIYKDINKIDSFVVLTEYMPSAMGIKTKPYTVIEGIVKPTEDINKKEIAHENIHRKIVYTGTLEKKYGIEELVNAFHKLEMDNIELIICGGGNSELYIKKMAKIDKRIKYFGIVTPEKAKQLQREAYILVNPRSNKEEYTKFSFPSKTLEYMDSGKPVLMYHLSGIPAEYDEFLLYIDEDCDGLYKALKRNLEKERYELISLGDKAKKFVDSQKNNVIQSKKIINMLNKIKNDNEF